MPRSLAALVGTTMLLGVLTADGLAQTRIPPEQREEVERRVSEMEAQFRRIRDEKLALCRGTWSKCTNQKCKRIQVADGRWQVCQDACDAEYERCKEVAHEYWPEGE